MNRSIVIFTSYPRTGRIHDAWTVGVAAYTKLLLTALKAKDGDLAIEVVGEIHDEAEGDGVAGGEAGREASRESGIEVQRIWKRGDALSLVRALARIFRSPARTVVVSYEVNMVGGKAVNALFLLLLAVLRLRKRVVILIHQVPQTFAGLIDGPIRSFFWGLGKGALFKLIALGSSERVVFEAPLARAFPGRKRPICVPFAVEAIEPLDPRVARERLGLEPGIFHLLFFGYLSPYKGLDLLLDLLGPAGEGIRLIVAGDGNPNRRKGRDYARYVDTVKARARERGALVAGFVEEKEIGLYFGAADAVVFPYRVFFSSSYVLSLAFSHERPVLLSRALERYFEGRDFEEAADRAGLSKEDLTFDFTSDDFSRKVRAIAGNRGPYVRFSRGMKEARSLANVIPLLQAVLDGAGGKAEDR